MNILGTALLLAIGVTLCHSQNSVLDVAAANGCSKVVDLITKAGLKDAIEAAPSVTFFAPNDTAIANIPADVLKLLTANATLLQEVLKFHVLPQARAAGIFKNDALYPTLLEGSKMRTNAYVCNEIRVTAEGRRVYSKDIQADNGLVHILAEVIYPVPSLSLPLYLTFDQDLTNLGFLAFEDGIINKLMTDGLTMFAPSNEAIKKIPAQDYINLLMNKTLLTEVLTYHVVKGTTYSAAFFESTVIPTLNGAPLKVEVDGAGRVAGVGGAKVVRADLSVTNGVIHVIDTVLMPPTQ